MDSRLTSSPLPPAPSALGFAEPDRTPQAATGNPAKEISYWTEYLAGAPALSLPADRRASANNLRFAERLWCIPSKLRTELCQCSERESTPLAIMLLSAFAVLLQRYTSQEDVVIACSLADAERQQNDGSHPVCKGVMLRLDLSDDPGMRAFLQKVQEEIVKVNSHSRCSLAELISSLRTSVSGDSSFKAAFSYQTSGWTSIDAKEFLPVDWHLQVLDGQENLSLRLIYNAERFEAATIDRVLNNYQTLLEGMAANPESTLSRVPMLSDAEKQKVLVEWNRTGAETPRKCLHELIEEQAERWPTRIAVISDGHELTYREFNTRANRLAHYLRSRGVGTNQRIGICLDHSSAFAVAVLGVLKSGAACVPLDPDYPKERLAYMLEDVQAHVLITGKDVRPEAIPANCEVLLLEDDAATDTFSSQLASNPASGVTPDDIAYVIYTSGSTGKPRGVLLTHGGLVNYNIHAARTYSMTPDDRVLQFCSISFDIALEELFITWLSGATLVFRTDSVPVAVPEFLEWVEQQRITVLDLPTAYWHEWVHELPQLKHRVLPQGLRLVIVGGEKPSSQAYGAWLAAVRNRVRWINTYGPTEISICATAYEPTWQSTEQVPENIPIGRPLPNVRVYLLDRHLNPAPIGVAGELHVAGAGVAHGYLNRPELTAQKFIADPFSNQPGARLYNTGDLARYLPSGEIEFLGRSDDQIKIRGFRIELGEIESALTKHPGVREAVVVAREDGPGDKQLVAYFVPAASAEPAATELRRFLQKQLPDYMVPATFVTLQALPMTPNGKVNRRGLPAPPAAPVPATFERATDPLQLRLVELWEEVLGKKPIGIHDNFFDLGGHSLLAARLMHRIGQMLGKTLPLAMLFRTPTIEQLAAVLQQDDLTAHWSSLVPIQTAGSRPPFFCIHGVGGNVLGFHLLGRNMAPDHPFYGLQSQGLDGKRPYLSSIEAMASHYIAEMRSVQPHGPYFLGGFSFGGLVGYEIAQQLRAAGEETALLVLFDTYPGEVRNGASSFVKLLLNPSRQHWFHDVPRAIDKKIRRTWRTMQVPQALRDLHAANRLAASKYILQAYAGKVTLVRATKKLLSGSDPHAAWRGLVGSLAEHEIASGHYDILLEPQVKTLAAQLRTWIDEAQAERQEAVACLQAS